MSYFGPNTPLTQGQYFTSERSMRVENRRRATVVCCKGADFLAIELQDPTTGKRMWSLPGGKIEKNETPEEAAIRETLEETGHFVALRPALEKVTQYLFDWDTITFDCTTHWFAARLTEQEPIPVDDEAYLLGHRWLPVANIDELFAYHPHIRDVAKELATTT